MARAASDSDGEVVAAVRRDLAKLPKELAESGLSASALALAREMDTPNSATSKSMCAKALQEALRELRALAPPETERDSLDDITAGRALRLAASGGTAIPN